MNHHQESFEFWATQDLKQREHDIWRSWKSEREELIELGTDQVVTEQIVDLQRENEELKGLFNNYKKNNDRIRNDYIERCIVQSVEIKDLKALLYLAKGTIDSLLINEGEYEKNSIWSRARAIREDINKKLKELK